MQKSKKIYCRYLLVLSLLVSLITGICTSAFADSYTYDIRGNQVPAPDAYELERTVYASELGLESMSTVSDVYKRQLLPLARWNNWTASVHWSTTLGNPMPHLTFHPFPLSMTQ